MHDGRFVLVHGLFVALGQTEFLFVRQHLVVSAAEAIRSFVEAD
jgi:hypothetical protein